MTELTTAPRGGYAARPAAPSRDADPSARQRVRRILGLALGSAALAVVVAVVAAYVVLQSPSACPSSDPAPGWPGWVEWPFRLGYGLAAGSLAACIAGAVSAARRLAGTRSANRWIGTFALAALVVPALAATVVEVSYLAIAVTNGMNCGL